MNEVSTKTTASMPKKIAKAPLITFVKYNTATNAVNAMRIILSAEPIFFFILLFIYLFIVYKLIYIFPSATIGYIGMSVLF